MNHTPTADADDESEHEATGNHFSNPSLLSAPTTTHHPTDISLPEKEILYEEGKYLF